LADQVYGSKNPLERFYTDEPYQLDKANGRYRLKLKLPFITKKDVELNKIYDELIIRIGSFKRHILLPKQVAAHEALKAKLEGQHLNITFEEE
jgi:arsenite-transporting ATPase